MYISTAYNKLEEVKDNLDKAIKSLTEIVINRCEGWDELQIDKKVLQQALIELLDIKNSLEE